MELLVQVPRAVHLGPDRGLVVLEAHPLENRVLGHSKVRIWLLPKRLVGM